MDEPEHSRYRKPLTGKFTVRRMRLLTERVEQITADHLDAMEKAGPPADLVTAFAKPIPAIMICELLGRAVRGPRAPSRSMSTTFISGGGRATRTSWPATPRPSSTSHELVAAKRAEPTDDVLSDLHRHRPDRRGADGYRRCSCWRPGSTPPRTCWPSAPSPC